MIEDFSKSGWIEAILKILQDNKEESSIAFNILILSFTKTNIWKKILEDNCFFLLSYLNQNHIKYPDEDQDKIVIF